MNSSLVERSRPPAPGKVHSFDFPVVRSSVLANGLALRVACLPRLPLVTSALVLPVGESVLDEACAGHAMLTGDALEGVRAYAPVRSWRKPSKTSVPRCAYPLDGTRRRFR